MHQLTPDIKTVKTAAEKALNLPTDSILVVESGSIAETVVHRTGITGWMITRSVPPLNLKGGKYLHYDEIRSLFELIESRGGTLTVLRIGKDRA